MNDPSRTVVITGAAGHIGRAYALKASMMASCILIDRDTDPLEAVMASLNTDAGQSHRIMHCDLIDSAARKSLLDQLTRDETRIDVLVNNVGQSEPGGPYDMALETWRGQFALNIDTAFMAIKHVLPSMRARKNGAIINVSSVAGMRYIGKPQVGYAAAKAALVQMTKTTAIIEAPHNIRLNCVVPGLMHTPLVQVLAQKYAGGDTEAFVAKRNNQVPMGRMGDAWDVAHAAIYLGSDEASYVTGTELVVDGGITATTP